LQWLDLPTMKITLIGPTYPFRGGISHYTTLLCQHLRKRHDVRFFTFYRQYPAWLYPGQSDRDEHSQNVLRVESEALLDGVNPLTWWRVLRDIRRAPPDMLIVQWTVSFWMPLLWCVTRFSPATSKVVMICHNASPHEKDRRGLAALMRKAQQVIMGQTDCLICHAQSDEEELRHLLPNHQIARVMLPSYAELATLSTSTTSSKTAKHSSAQPNLLFFGFVRPYKGVDVLLDAMPQVLEALPKAHLTVAGEWWAAAGDPQAWLSEQIKEAVTILNRYIPNEEMAQLFTQADVVVLPYRSATQSAVVQLAYGFGVPVITTAVGGLPEAVEDEYSGFIVPPDEAQALAQAIIRYHREGWRAKLAEGVKEKRERFSWQKMVEALEEIEKMALTPPTGGVRAVFLNYALYFIFSCASAITLG